MTRTLLSLLLVFSMMLGFVVIPANAAGTDKTSFNYVSLGASNTNGYGMRGYITEAELNAMLSGQVSKDEVNVYGYQRTPEGAYPDLIRDHYAGVYSNVNLDQLAISSMRVEELRVLLDDSYMGDDYTSWRFTGSDGWFKSAEPGGLPALREAYKESITNADLITVDIGWNNFGVYVCNQLVDYMSNGRYKWTTDITSIYETAAEKEAAQEAKAIIGSYIKEYVGEGDMANALTDIFAYSILGYMHNFDICMEKIYELNPDADVVVLGIQNLLYGVVVDIQGTKMPLGDIFGNFVNMANYYASDCSPYHDDYLYVKAGSNEHVTIFLDYMKSYVNGTAKDLDQNVKDCFDYYDNDLFIQTQVDYMAAELIKQIVIEKFGENMLDTALNILDCKDWLEVVAKGKAGELPTDLLGNNFQEMFDDKYWPALHAAYDTLAVLVKEIAIMESVDANGLLAGTVNISAVENSLKKALKAEIQNNAIAAASGEQYTVDLDTLLPDANSKVVAAMYIRYYMGNSFFAHPNGTGHAEIKNAVLGVINNPASEKDQALSDYLIESVKQIHQLICGATGHEETFSHTTAASCDDPAVTTTFCSCGKETTETIGEKLGHNYTAGDPVWAEDYTSCSITFTCERGCTETVTDTTISSQVTKEATCEEAGEIKYTADFSDSELVEEAVTTTAATSALEHDWDEGEVTKQPTETETGIKTFTCTREGCGETMEETIPVKKPDHTHKHTKTVTAPTCTEDGYTTYTCSCGDTYIDDEVPALGHTEETVERKEATCTVDGHEEGTRCTVCGETLSGMAAIPAVGHKSETLEGKDPTCTEDGLTDGVVCTICETVLTEQKIIPSLGHDYVDGICTRCEEEEPSEKPTVTRFSGEDRYSTAFNVAEAMKEIMKVKTFDSIVVAYGRNFADALAGSYLANELDAPILLTEDSVQTDVIDYIAENLSRNGKVYILGGTASISASFEEALDDAEISCERLSGDNRYLTNLAILMEADLNGETVLVCDGSNFADSLSASSLDLPILLVGDSLSKEQKDYLDTLDNVSFKIIGGINSVNEAIAEVLEDYGTVERISGATREETSVAVAEAFFSSPETILMAYSRNFPDGLCGGPLAYQMGAPLILINSGAESFATDYVAENEITSGIILGGTSSVPDDVANAVFPQ